MKRFFLFCTLLLAVCLSGGQLQGQTRPLLDLGDVAPHPQTVKQRAARLQRFGRAVPQEKVYVHMDNTCYFVGDTLWFAAYSRRTDTGLPSAISRVLYAELWTQDGYLVERQLIKMERGRGHGSFVIADSLYGGFYELRAYTRWQLNWGQTERAHTSKAEDWFYSEDLAHEYYRDYDKLYSRVFPVYDKPATAGDYQRDMTTRPLRRYYSTAAAASPMRLSLLPEGGNLVAGAPCRVAFEAATEEGEPVEGMVTVTDADGATVATAQTRHQGRGSFEFTPSVATAYTASFVPSAAAQSEKKVKQRLPKTDADGVSMRLTGQGETWKVALSMRGAASATSLGFTLMHEGVVTHFEEIATGQAEALLTFHADAFQAGPGVYQATVFDAAGRVWSDRLFFVGGASVPATLSVAGAKDSYQPYETIQLDLAASQPSAVGTAISIAVRDAGTQDYIQDCGTLLTEMLLASEIKGFVAEPTWYFERDDEEHRTALDLLMLTQGWRRFSWREMAIPGSFALSQPAEYTQVLMGQVLPIGNVVRQDEFRPITPTVIMFNMEGSQSDAEALEQEGFFELAKVFSQQAKAAEYHLPAGSYRMDGIGNVHLSKPSTTTFKHEHRVHAEFVQPGYPAVLGDVDTKKGFFTIQAPDFIGQCVLFLAASDTTQWKGTHSWVDGDETHVPETYVRLSWPYPRFVKPYHYFQVRHAAAPWDATKATAQTVAVRREGLLFDTQMNGFTVRARHSGLRKFDASKPVLRLDAYKAFNEVADAGLSMGYYEGRINFVNGLARCYVGDMNTEHSYLLEPRYNGRNRSFSFTPGTLEPYNSLFNLDSVYIYTDYAPRLPDERFSEDNIGRVTVNLIRPADEGQRVTYRDRRYVLEGFAVAEDFYHPDYSRQMPVAPTDYRRTLYWNPDLQLDATGRAHVKCYNNAHTTSITVQAEGQAADGTILITK